MSWETIERRAEKGPLAIGVWAIVIVACLIAVIWGVSFIFRGVGQAGNVAQEQFGARGSLVKYEWFKDASEAIEAKSQSIKVYDENLKALERQYEGTPRAQWPRDDREAFNMKSMELAGMKASYNNLVRDYNANSAKFNWSFAKTGDNLPRTYMEK